MSKYDFYIKEGDRDPDLIVTAIDQDGEVVPLDAAVAVKFFMYDPGSADPKIDGVAANILAPPADGKMEYEWAANDTDTPGGYDGEFEVEWSDGNKTTFPNFRMLRIKIGRSIDTSD